MSFADHNSRPASDDQVSVGSYSSDAHTLPCDVEDDVHSTASHDSFDSWCDEADFDQALPSYRVREKEGVSAPVYEAWTLYLSDTQDVAEKTSFCGLNVTKRCPENQPFVSCTNQYFDQNELSVMTMDAVRQFQSANKRSLPSRMIRRRARSYENDLDERIQKLPRPIQSELYSLLADREYSSSNRFHRRDWTVVVMEEEYRYRFASTECELVKKPRFWKRKKEAQRPKQYFFVIRGGEGRVATDDKGMHRARRYGNPWKRVDATERVQKQQTRDIRRFGKAYGDGYSGRQPALSIRSMSPPPSRRVRLEHDDPEEYPPSPLNPFLPGPQHGGSTMHPLAPPPLGPFASYPAPPACHFSFPTMPPRRDCRSAPPVNECDFSYVDAAPSCLPPPPPAMPTSVFRPSYDCAGFDMPHASYPPSIPPPATRTGFHVQMNHHQGIRPIHAFPPQQPHSQICPLCFDLTGGAVNHSSLSSEYTGSYQPSPPPAPRLSNLTTPTTFSPATSNHTGSSSDQAAISIHANTGSVEPIQRNNSVVQ